MASQSIKHSNRHFKTLILLVVSMTAGAFLLFWIDKHTPTHRPRTLRGLTASKPWTDVAIRSAASAQGVGLFHFRIDADGNWYQSSAWKNGLRDPASEGTIHILLTRDGGRSGSAQSQQLGLRRLVDQLQREHRIDSEHVRAIQADVIAPGLIAAGNTGV